MPNKLKSLQKILKQHIFMRISKKIEKGNGWWKNIHHTNFLKFLSWNCDGKNPQFFNSLHVFFCTSFGGRKNRFSCSTLPFYRGIFIFIYRTHISANTRLENINISWCNTLLIFEKGHWNCLFLLFSQQEVSLRF